MAASVNLNAYRDLQFGRQVVRATALPPQGVSAGIFTITGSVILFGLFGEITTAIGAVANATKVLYNPTATGASTDLCATLDINAAAAGLILALPAAVGSAMNSGVLTNTFQAPNRILYAGQLELSCAGSSVTGSIAWTAYYVPHLNGGAMVAA